MEDARPATAADLERLAELAREARRELLPLRGGDVFVQREGRIEDFARDVDDDATMVLCGTIDDVVVGYAAVTLERLGDGRTLGRVRELYVEEGGRGVGVGERLIDEVIAWCSARGCFGIDAHALPGTRETKNFFETAGFTARLLVVHRRLGT
jgi:GNAT superfamily N-acetyltransferase